MESEQPLRLKETGILLLVTTVLFLFFFYFHVPLDYEQCPLCDRNEYKKVYDYFEFGTFSQIKFPYYARPIVPLLASWIPGTDMPFSFHVINYLFVVLSVIAIWKLWHILNLPKIIMAIGMAWLTLHWSGIIRYNMMDFVTVDVPVYLVETVALILFIKKKFKWFYLLTPLAILQKESFTPIMMVLIMIQIFYHRKSNVFSASKHLIFSLVLGIVVQKTVVWLMPEQEDQRISIMALFWHLRWALDDPTRFVRLFAAFGCAFGVFPVLILLRFQLRKFQNLLYLTLTTMTMLFIVLGISAGEDMTRIMFLGFPFIMTLSLIHLKEERLPVIVGAVLLSLPFMRLFPFHVNLKWSVDYAPISYVYEWAGYYVLTIFLFVLITKFSDKKASLSKDKNL